MNARTCACPYCDCPVESREWVHEVAGDDLLYCCEACMQRHPKGLVPCHSPGCDCGERMERERELAS
ncbi:metallothionein [uncultured Pseudomonas sp.]|uniref:metallothionein n=1 Tax=uncultured Pseudomonas sp. TaxID=114707 RepID=UPI0025E503C2|nr:metallothionein [uncultured Pseudomonas sp.]